MIYFYLQAHPTQKKDPASGVIKKSLRIREHYHYEGGPKIIRGNKEAFSVILDEIVDEPTKRDYPKEYKKFSDYVQKHEDKLFEAARAQPGVPYKFELSEVKSEEVKTNGSIFQKVKKAKA